MKKKARKEKRKQEKRINPKLAICTLLSESCNFLIVIKPGGDASLCWILDRLDGIDELDVWNVICLDEGGNLQICLHIEPEPEPDSLPYKIDSESLVISVAPDTTETSTVTTETLIRGLGDIPDFVEQIGVSAISELTAQTIWWEALNKQGLLYKMGQEIANDESQSFTGWNGYNARFIK